MSDAAAKILVFGATGLLGKALMGERGAREVVGLSSQQADIRDAPHVAQVMRQAKPQWVVLSAAYTNVDGCETNQELAFAVNTQGAANVAEAARHAGSRLLFVSTDYVLTEERLHHTKFRPTQPNQRYGQTKSEAEERLLEIILTVHCSHLLAVRGGRHVLPSYHAVACGEAAADQRS